MLELIHLFDLPDLAGHVASLAPEEIDRLPFGAIRLDASGLVVFYSRTEAALSGYGDRPVLGRPFFRDIAPCMDHPDFAGRIQEARAAGTLDIEFGWVGDFSDRDRFIRIRAQSAPDGGVWIFTLRGE